MLALALLELLLTRRWRRRLLPALAGAAWLPSQRGTHAVVHRHALEHLRAALRPVSIFSDAAKSGRPVLGRAVDDAQQHLLMFNLRAIQRAPQPCISIRTST